MAINGRMLQRWRIRLNIKQKDLALFLMIDNRELQAVENHRYHPDARDIRARAEDALAHFDKTDIATLAYLAQTQYENAKGFEAVAQAMTGIDLTQDYYLRQFNKARAQVRIVDQLKFVKGPLPTEALYLLKFEKGRHLRIFGKLTKLGMHVFNFYRQDDVKDVELIHTAPA